MNSLLKGVIAGIAGTGVMTAYQMGVAKLRGQPVGTDVPHRWADAPAPAQVAKKAADAVGQGSRFTREDVPLLTNAMHWLYGIGWGAPVRRGRTRSRAASPSAPASGARLRRYPGLRGAVEYPKRELALDLSYHLVYGSRSRAYAALDSR